jgi:prepilin-type N-terminal cleavage/methylation domain-containing protein
MLRKAFTLIELLVVVAIISVLVSLLLPALSKARAQAQKTRCAANLHQLAVAMYSYWTEWNGRVPCVETPMVNKRFGDADQTDAEVNPFDRERWPISLPNVLLGKYVGEQAGVFACPAARVGWPRQSRPFRFTYREAGRNQPNGKVTREGSYEREHFGFMDGRQLAKFRMNLVADPQSPNDYIQNAEEYAKSRGVYVRDLIYWENGRVFGPHNGGVMVINRDMQVEFRNQNVTNDDLAPNEFGSKF